MKQQGFTLIELLVVIGIITIIVGIATASFRTASATMRDGKRKADITALAKSMEAAKNYATGMYFYKSTALMKDFSRVPVDPLYIPSTERNYCIQVSGDSSIPPTEPTTNWTSCNNGDSENDCVPEPIVTPRCEHYYINIWSMQGITLRQGNVKSWTLCASMERESTPFCIKSLNR